MARHNSTHRTLHWFEQEVLDSYAMEGETDARAVLPAIRSSILSAGDADASNLDCAAYQAYLDRWHENPLLMASRRGYERAIRRAIEQGTPIDTRDEEGKTSLHRAILGNQIDAALLLIELGAGPSAKDGEGMTPLHWAVLTMPGEECVDLVAAGCDPYLKGSDGDTPLDGVYDEELEADILKAHAICQAARLQLTVQTATPAPSRARRL